MLLLHWCCHFVWRNLLIVGFRSVYGILDLSGVRSKADLAAESARSFPLTSMWLGVQHIIISFLFDIESNLLNSLMISGFWNFLFLNDSKTETVWKYYKSSRWCWELGLLHICCEYRAFHWKSFLKNCFVLNSCARCFIIVLGFIRKDVEVVGVVLENIVKFLLISPGVGFSFGIFIQFENHFGSFNDPGWCLLKSAFMYII